jgi:UDP-N-acetylglucosamine 2-epimerase (non-hydrolysing)
MIPPVFARLFAAEWKKGSIPPLWDGKAGLRIVKVLEEQLLRKVMV